MPKRELAALRRDAERDAEQEREILRRRIESVYIATYNRYCNRALETGKCLCFSNFNAAMAGGDYDRVNTFFKEIWKKPNAEHRRVE